MARWVWCCGRSPCSSGLCPLSGPGPLNQAANAAALLGLLLSAAAVFWHVAAVDSAATTEKLMAQRRVARASRRMRLPPWSTSRPATITPRLARVSLVEKITEARM